MFAQIDGAMLLQLSRFIKLIEKEDVSAEFKILCLGCGFDAEEVFTLSDYFHDSENEIHFIGIDKNVSKTIRTDKIEIHRLNFSAEEKIRNLIYSTRKKIQPYELYPDRYTRQEEPTTYTVAFVAWPDIHTTGIAHILQQTNIVVYVGKNDGVTACGDAEFWQVILECYVPVIEVQARHNDMVIYVNQQNANMSGFYQFWRGDTKKISPREEILCYNPYNVKRQWKV